ncbi:putative sugar phosphate isomerase RBE_0278 [Candidatus Xenohaliotis californiensis]|uniref:Sugar phosphate isomerase RBE_0278 n=1 Tax=Candidatus Xenohaliotis californiensis TaxID=84677 RepID=A0ABP0EWN0_9RICK|nr:putative sugar phosphate isomerase RBE_0278 [Candidatus Xenohaliotis californiensis]
MNVNDNKIRIFIASDHAGYLLKRFILQQMNKYDICNKGCNSLFNVDYPDYAHIVANAITNNLCDIGILICSTGIGMSIVANRYQSIRAALCHNLESVSLARKHNNANVLCIGAKFIDSKLAINMVEAFIKTDFDAGRHLIRVQKYN